MFATMSYSFQEAAKQQGSASGAEMDEIKRMLVETNPWFLGITALVSMLHVVYEYPHQKSISVLTLPQLRNVSVQFRRLALEKEARTCWCFRKVSMPSSACAEFEVCLIYYVRPIGRYVILG